MTQGIKVFFYGVIATETETKDNVRSDGASYGWVDTFCELLRQAITYYYYILSSTDISILSWEIKYEIRFSRITMELVGIVIFFSITLNFECRSECRPECRPKCRPKWRLEGAWRNIRGVLRSSGVALKSLNTLKLCFNMFWTRHLTFTKM